MKTLLLLTTTYPGVGGDASFVQHEIAALASEFDEVTVVSSRQLESQPNDLPQNVIYAGDVNNVSIPYGVAALLVPRIALRFLAVLFRELVLMSEWRNVRDLLYFSLLGAGYARAISKLVPLRTSRGTVYSFWAMELGLSLPWLRAQNTYLRVHRFDLYEDERGYLPFRRSLYSAATGILAISEDGREYLCRRYPKLNLESKIQVCRLGTADHGIGPKSKDADQFTIVSCSAVSHVKRVQSILDALKTRDSHGIVRWIHFGDGPLLPVLERAAADVALPSTRIELRGKVANSELMGFYRSESVDVFVNVSSSEGVPVSIMEAMSFGIPIVATDAGGTREVVDNDSRAGVVLPINFSSNDLNRAIDMVVDHRSEFCPRDAWENLCRAETNAKVVARILAKSTTPIV